MQKFLVWFQHRSGSTHLVSLLNSHQEIHCRGEMFGCIPVKPNDPSLSADRRQFGERSYLRVINLFPGRIESPDDPTCIEELVRFYEANDEHDRPTNCHQVIRGFKFKFPSQSSLFPEIGDWLQDRRSEIKVIALYRRNFLRRALSVLNLPRVQETTGRANVTQPLILSPANFEVAEVIRLINYYASMESEFREAVCRFTDRIEIEYDDLTSNEERTGERLQEFLNVKQVQELRSKTRRLTPRQLDGVVANLKELEAALRENGWEQFLR